MGMLTADPLTFPPSAAVSGLLNQSLRLGFRIIYPRRNFLSRFSSLNFTRLGPLGR